MIARLAAPLTSRITSLLQDWRCLSGRHDVRRWATSLEGTSLRARPDALSLVWRGVCVHCGEEIDALGWPGRPS